MTEFITEDDYNSALLNIMKGPGENSGEGKGTDDIEVDKLLVYIFMNIFHGIPKRNSIVDNKASRTFPASNNSLLVFRIMLKEHQ